MSYVLAESHGEVRARNHLAIHTAPGGGLSERSTFRPWSAREGGAGVRRVPAAAIGAVTGWPPCTPAIPFSGEDFAPLLDRVPGTYTFLGVRAGGSNRAQSPQ